jgi:hypothetical protein
VASDAAQFTCLNYILCHQLVIGSTKRGGARYHRNGFLSLLLLPLRFQPLDIVLCHEKWIFIFFSLVSGGQSDVEVQLRVKKYVEKGSHVTIYCDHNVKPEILYKVCILYVYDDMEDDLGSWS